jgi:hypothetical protein
MRTLSAADLLSVWERGRNREPVQQAIELLAAASPSLSREDLLRLTIGQRDAALLMLREVTFGPQIRSVVECPCCNTKLELSVAVCDVSLTHGGKAPEEIVYEGANYALRIRLPSSADIAAAMEARPEQRANSLFHRCVVSATHRGEPAPELPKEIMEEVSKRISEADPQADVQLRVVCSCCRHEWSVLFDIVSFFWKEIESWAARLLGEVHALASVYGWSERDILSLSPLRRQFYLEAARA